MRIDGVRSGAGAGGPTVSTQDEYRHQLLQQLRRRALERRRGADGARDRVVTGSGLDDIAADAGLYEATAGAGDAPTGVRRRPSGSRP